MITYISVETLASLLRLFLRYNSKRRLIDTVIKLMINKISNVLEAFYEQPRDRTKAMEFM